MDIGEGRKEMKVYNCKVGTIPSQIQLKRNYKIEVGASIKWRHKGYFHWEDGEIWKVNDDGYFFVRLI